MLGLGSRALFKGLGVIFGILAISWLALEYFVPSPPSRITLASGPQGTSLLYFGQRYRERLARVGIDVDLRETAGTTENCKLLHDPNSDVDVSIVTPGFCDNSRGSELLSLGEGRLCCSYLALLFLSRAACRLVATQRQTYRRGARRKRRSRHRRKNSRQGQHRLENRNFVTSGRECCRRRAK